MKLFTAFGLSIVSFSEFHFFKYFELKRLASNFRATKSFEFKGVRGKHKINFIYTKNVNLLSL